MSSAGAICQISVDSEGGKLCLPLFSRDLVRGLECAGCLQQQTHPPQLAEGSESFGQAGNAEFCLLKGKEGVGLCSLCWWQWWWQQMKCWAWQREGGASGYRGQSHSHSMSPTAGSGAGRGVGCTHGWQLSQTAEEYRSSSSPHSSPPETSLLDLPKTIPPPSRTHLLGHAWFYTNLLLSW